MVTVKKVKLRIVGDKDEVNRVYEFLRNAQYTQYKLLNLIMSQVGTIYYKYNRDFKSEGFQSEYRDVFRISNALWHDDVLPKGLVLQAVVSQKVKSDFSTALKNGLAKGERSLPSYRRDFPLMVVSRILNFEGNYDEANDKEEVYIRFCNKIRFKCVMGTSKDRYLRSLLYSLADKDDDTFSVCQSSIEFKGKDIILNLSVRKNSDVTPYVPEVGKKMVVGLGYSNPVTVGLSTENKTYDLCGFLCQDVIQRRINIDRRRTELQKSLVSANGGRGRKKKLAALERFKSYERNTVKLYNHKISKAIVDFAVRNYVETIVLENISKDLIEDYPVVLRNWSYYELESFISYKAKAVGIKCVSAKDSGRTVNTCSECGVMCDDKNYLPEAYTWTEQLNFKCPECGKEIPFVVNKIRNLLKEE